MCKGNRMYKERENVVCRSRERASEGDRKFGSRCNCSTSSGSDRQGALMYRSVLLRIDTKERIYIYIYILSSRFRALAIYLSSYLSFPPPHPTQKYTQYNDPRKRGGKETGINGEDHGGGFYPYIVYTFKE